MADEKNTQFNYLLNAVMHAAKEAHPAKDGYAGKYKALIAHVRELERKAAAYDMLAAPQPVACGLRTSDGVLHSLKSIESRQETARTAQRMRQTLVLLAECPLACRAGRAATMAADQLDRERKAFEEWAVKFGLPIEHHPTAPSTNYLNRDTTFAWVGWQGKAAAGVEASPDPARELLRQSREALRKDGRFVSTGEHVELRRAISAYLGDFGYGEQPDPCGVPVPAHHPSQQKMLPKGGEE